MSHNLRAKCDEMDAIGLYLEVFLFMYKPQSEYIVDHLHLLKTLTV